MVESLINMLCLRFILSIINNKIEVKKYICFFFILLVGIEDIIMDILEKNK